MLQIRAGKHGKHSCCKQVLKDIRHRKWNISVQAVLNRSVQILIHFYKLNIDQFLFHLVDGF